MSLRIRMGLGVLFSSAGLAMPALADTPTAIDWGTALKGGAIAAGLWILANLLGHLWIRSRKRKENRPEE